ncbi:hypothetical protein DFH07DRAFT_345694 [Mycena maculata]|uniref:Uncharacterized protein n=1 Tax=Mycena maculata TaxID=230809 RepID=A0AAD7JKQ4_9AGAR|nr:hypothetical protein DFH07DRAFT_345694 [Mycena maculata]
MAREIPEAVAAEEATSMYAPSQAAPSDRWLLEASRRIISYSPSSISTSSYPAPPTSRSSTGAPTPNISTRSGVDRRRSRPSCRVRTTAAERTAADSPQILQSPMRTSVRIGRGRALPVGVPRSSRVFLKRRFVALRSLAIKCATPIRRRRDAYRCACVGGRRGEHGRGGVEREQVEVRIESQHRPRPADDLDGDFAHLQETSGASGSRRRCRREVQLDGADDVHPKLETMACRG